MNLKIFFNADGTKVIKFTQSNLLQETELLVQYRDSSSWNH